MAKLPDPTPHFNDRDQAIFDKLKGPRDGLSGMYLALMNHPELADRVGDLGFHLRYCSRIPGDAREVAILATAQEVGARFVWLKHIAPARRAGLPEEVIKALEQGRFDKSIMPRHFFEIWGVARDIVRQDSIPVDRQAYLIQHYDLQQLIELVVICGFYRMIAGVVLSFDVDLPE